MEALVLYAWDGHKKRPLWIDGTIKINTSTRNASVFSEDGKPVASGKIPANAELVEGGTPFVLDADGPKKLTVTITAILSGGGAPAAPAANENAPPEGERSGPRKSFTRPSGSSGPPRRPAAPAPDARPAAPRPAWQQQQRMEEAPAQRPHAALKPPAAQQQRSAADILRLLGGGGAEPAAPAQPQPLQPQAQSVAPPARHTVEPPAPKRLRVAAAPLQQAQQAQQQQPSAAFQPAALPQREQQPRAPIVARQDPGTGRWDHQRPRGTASIPVQHKPAPARAAPSHAPPPPSAPTLVLSSPPQPGVIIYSPSEQECERPQRAVAVPDRFLHARAYQHAWGASLGEEVTLQVAAAVKSFHAAAKQLPPGADARAVAAVMHKARVPYYGECELRVWFGKAPKTGGGKKKFGGGPYRKQRGESESDEEEEREGDGAPPPPDTHSLILKSGRQPNGDYGKSDVWIIGTDPLLRGGGGGRPGEDRNRAHWVALVRSMWFAPSKDGKFEIQFLSGQPAQLPKSTKVYALKGPNAHTELSLLDLLSSPALGALPLLPALLGNVSLAYDPPGPLELDKPAAQVQSAPFSERDSPMFNDELEDSEAPSSLPEVLPETPAEAAESVIRRFQLNPEQAQVVRHVAAWAHDRSASSGPAPAPPICLCFGPFGCGKSTLLVAVLHLIMALRDMELPTRGESDGKARRGHGLTGARVLVSAHTNVAVDRVLLSLMDSGRTDFMRVGPLRRVDRRLLPYSLHATESKNAPSAAEELRKMLNEGIDAGSLTLEDERTLRAELEEAEGGKVESRRRKLLKTVPVVGVTCCSALTTVMEKMSFDVVVLDESSQVIEPLALAPLLRARARFLVAAGDPRQLPPLVATPALPAGSTPATAGDDTGTGPQGLARPLFVRLSALGASPHLLRLQYRCNPAISAIPNSHFYNGRLLDGCTVADRPSLLPGLPNVVFVDVRGDSQYKHGSTWNPREADAVVMVVERALGAGVDPRKIGVVCFFTAQVAAVRARLKGAAPALQEAAEAAAAARADAEGRAVWAAKARTRRVLKETSSEDDEGGGSSDNESSSDEEEGGGKKRPAKFSTAGAAVAVQVATVDAFQGAEKDVIVLTAAVASKNAFIGDAARLNVALTRARHNLVLLGNGLALQQTATAFDTLIKAAKKTPGGYGAGGQLPVGTRPAQ